MSRDAIFPRRRPSHLRDETRGTVNTNHASPQRRKRQSGIQADVHRNVRSGRFEIEIGSEIPDEELAEGDHYGVNIVVCPRTAYTDLSQVMLQTISSGSRERPEEVTLSDLVSRRVRLLEIFLNAPSRMRHHVSATFSKEGRPRARRLSEFEVGHMILPVGQT